ncbi:MAG: hypothetical protein ACLFPU_01130 [Dehalococcoidia bacterium]
MKNLSSVKCHSGYTYAERLEALPWEGQTRQVENIEKEWREPGEKHFYVRTEDDKRFHVCYDELRDNWVVEPISCLC